MRSIILAAIVILAGTAVGRADDEYDVKVYPCPRAASALTIDGVLDEPSWQGAVLASGFTRYKPPEPVAVQTYLRVLHDEKRLYFGIECDEPFMDRFSPVTQTRDAHNVFQGETIELFVDPKHDHQHYYQIAVSAAGSVYDSAVMEPSWSAKVVAAVNLGQAGWTLEVSIPWSDLGVMPEAGRLIGFNVCRDRGVVQEHEWSNWAQTEGDFHDPIRFGHLVLSATPERIAELATEFRKGDRHGRIIVYGSEASARRVHRELAKRALDRLDRCLADLDQSRRQEKNAKAQAELAKRIAANRKEVAPYRQKLADNPPIDAAVWARMEHRITQLIHRLEAGIWDARLSALLSGI